MNIIKKCAEKINTYIKTRRSVLQFFIVNNKLAIIEENAEISGFTDISDYETLEKFSIEHNNTLKHLLNDDCKKRFLNGSLLSLAMQGGEWVSYGWLAQEKNFWIAETDFYVNLDLADVGILFDFFTKEEYRGLGIYPSVISHLNTLSRRKTNIIYCYDSNIASQKGIKKAGAVFETELTHKSDSAVHYFSSHGIKVLGSKLILFGLKYKNI